MISMRVNVSPRGRTSWFIKRTSYFEKLTALLLVFLFAMSPLQNVVAQEAVTPLSSGVPDSLTIDSASLSTTDVTADPLPVTEASVSVPNAQGAVENIEAVPENTVETGAENNNIPALLSGLGDTPPPSVLNPTFTYQNNVAKVEKTSGALVQSLPITVPPGRNGMQPNLALAYNSQSLDESIVGYGWNINIPYIERINRRGTNNLYSDTYFYSSLFGELASTSVANDYRTKVENGDFLQYTFASSTATTSTSWVVYDKKGTCYTFGTTTQARMDNASNTAEVYRWMLEEVRDTNNNFIRFEYFKDAGQIYPYRIYYTGSVMTDGVFLVEFTRQTRSDISYSYKTRFLVQTNYRISEIQAKVDGVWVRKYVLSYTTGNNDLRSLLSSVTESGQNEMGTETKTLPAITFEYVDDAISYTYYTANTMWDIATPAYVPADVDGNGTLDIGLSMDTHIIGGTWTNQFQLNFNEGSFQTLTAPDGSHANPYFNEAWGSTATLSLPYETGTRFLDLNADGKTDVVRSEYSADTGSTTKRIYWNTSTYGMTANGDLSWTLSTTTLTMPLFSSAYSTVGIFGNINGDVLPDFEVAYSGGGNGAHFGNGVTGFDVASSNTFSPIGTLAGSGSADTQGNQLVDINGDGLDDWVRNDSGLLKVHLNNGKGWNSAYDTRWTLGTTSVDGAGRDKGVRFLDLNGDGLLDFVRSYHLDPYISIADGVTVPYPEVADINLVMLNTGSGWATTTVSLPYKIVTGYVASGMLTNQWYFSEMWDWSADGLTDAYHYKSAGKKPDMLKKITYQTGGTTDVEYSPTNGQLSAETSKHKMLPMTVYVVSKITNHDNNGNSQILNYTYDGGTLYWASPYDRTFAGFETITELRSDVITKTYYYQGNTSSTTAGESNDHVSKIGKPYREDTLSPSGALFKRSFFTYDNYDQNNGKNYVYLSKTLEQTYDGDNDHRDKAISYNYATSTGNLSDQIDWGEVSGSSDGMFSDTGNDAFTTSYAYATGTNTSLISSEKKRDQSLNVVSEVRTYFDNQSFGSLTKGNPTKSERKIDATTYSSTTRSYNSYGMATSEVDPRGNITNYTYDSYNLYVATSTNPISQVSGYLYDYSSGKVRQTTNVNGRTFKVAYDPLDRVSSEIQPDSASPNTLVTKVSYVYNDSFPFSVQKTRYLNSATSTDNYTYFDGFGRAVQERTEARGSNTFAVSDFVYDATSQLARTSLPYFASSTARSASTTQNALYTFYARDPLGRMISQSDAVGTTTTVYDDWTTTVTDAKGKYKDFTRDVFGNLVQVLEHNGTSTYVTSYQYNRLGNLTQSTDALSNVRNFTYDLLGHQTKAEDLHATSDTTFGSTTYAFDLAGNLAVKQTPNDETIQYSYDALNRVLAEDYTGQAGTDMSYAYDACAEGKGRLCFATSSESAIVSIYEYNALGGVAKETKKIGTISYATYYDYDRQGNLTQITYPDNSATAYIYNDAGSLEKIMRRDSPASSFIPVISATNYSPHGQVSYQKYANNTETCNTYDPNAVYRLTNKRTTAFGYPCSSIPNPQYATTSVGTVLRLNLLQDIYYTYDQVGNIDTLTEQAPNGTTRILYYSYDDLHRLVSAQTAVTNALPYQQSFTYNALGNITSVQMGTSSSSPNTYSIDLEGSSNQYLSAGNIMLGGGKTMTVEWWMKAESTPSDTMLIFGDNNGASQMTVRGIWGSSGVLAVDIYDNVQLKSCFISYSASAQWDHFAFVIDTGATAGSRCVAYVNGSIVSDTEDFAGNNFAESNANFIIGNDAALMSTRFFDGKIDDMRIWSDVRTASEISNNRNRQMQGTEQGLIHNWQLNNSYTDTVFGGPTLTAYASPVFALDVPFVGDSGALVTTYGYAGTGYANPHAPTTIGSTTYAYDNNGNVTSAGTSTFAWDYNNRLTRASSYSATSTFAYDHTSARVIQVIRNATTTYANRFYSIDTMSGTTSVATSTTYIYAGDTLVALVDHASTSSVTIRYSHPDHLSSLSILSDPSGSLSRATDYYPFGTIHKEGTDGITITIPPATTSAGSLDLEADEGDCIYSPDNGTLHPTTSMSFDLRLKPEHTLATGDFWGLVDGWYNTTAGQPRSFLFGLYKAGSVNRLALWISTNGTDNVGGYLDIASLPTDSWTRLSSSYNITTGAVRIWLNGSEQTVTKITGSGTINDNNVAVGIGCSYDINAGINDRFDGLIDEVRIYNALISSFSDTTELSTPYPSSLIGYWKLNNSYDDETTNNNDLSTGNSPTFSTDSLFGSVGTTTTLTYTYSSSTPTQRGYIGEYYDPASHLSYLNARYYDAGRGQFLSEDPSHLSIGNSAQIRQITGLDQSTYLMDPQTLNSYGYARNNPIRFKDPDGKYIEASISGTYMGWSGSAGFRVSTGGLNVFVSGGAGAGLAGYPISVSYTPGDVPHTVESTMTVGGSGAYYVGGGASVSGQYVPQTYSLNNAQTQYSVNLGIGADVYARKEISIPILGGKPPAGLVLSPGSPYSTPNYVVAPVQKSPQYISSGSSPTNRTYIFAPSYTQQLYTTPNGKTIDWYGNFVSTPPTQIKE